MNDENKPKKYGKPVGRKPLATDEKTVVMSMRMTESQRKKLRKLGGVGWIRKQIDQAVFIVDNRPWSGI